MSQDGLLLAIYNRLTENESIQEVFGGPDVVLYECEAPQDPGTLYGVHNIKGDHVDIFGDGNYFLDWYSVGPTDSDTVTALANATKKSLTLWIDKPNGSILEYVTDVLVPTGADEVKRRSMIFRATWVDRDLNNTLAIK